MLCIVQMLWSTVKHDMNKHVNGPFRLERS